MSMLRKPKTAKMEEKSKLTWEEFCALCFRWRQHSIKEDLRKVREEPCPKDV